MTHFYQFQHAKGEVVVYLDTVGKQTTFEWQYGHPQISKRQLTIRHAARTKSAPYSLWVNDKTIVEMRRITAIHSVGTLAHWGDSWVDLTEWDRQHIVKLHGEYHLKTREKPWAPTPPCPVELTSGPVPFYDPMVLHTPQAPYIHPSGLPECELEECKACAASYGACHECYNTGMVPKADTRSKQMNTEDVIATMQITQGAKVVSAKYLQPGYAAPAQQAAQNAYHFKNVIGLPLKKGDIIVVQTGAGYALATVDEPDARANVVSISLGSLKHVVGLVDLGPFNRIIEGENSAAHALALSEVTERLAKFKEQIGDNTYNQLSGILAPPTAKE